MTRNSRGLLMIAMLPALLTPPLFLMLRRAEAPDFVLGGSVGVLIGVALAAVIVLARRRRGCA